jgi:hypothetical protein
MGKKLKTLHLGGGKKWYLRFWKFSGSARSSFW